MRSRDQQKSIFNLALLGKQVWRLIHNTDSLFYKVFKARFFPSCSIMDEGVKTIGSYAWQSILKARHVIDLGSSWGIGDGSNVLIRGDKWLPGLYSSKVISPQKSFPMNANVCALMTENGASWDEDKDLFMGILNKHDHHLVERFAVIAWSIWYKRNAIRIGSSSLPRTQIHVDALERLNEFHQAQDIPMVSHQPSTPVHWCPPPNSWCKVNFDGAIFQELGAASIGIVIRDHEGKVIGAMSEHIALPPSV
nr:putative mitochondrial protein [Quercus suber]